MNKIKVIKTEEEYKEALDLVKRLMSYDPDPDSEKGEQLNLLSTLVQDYETRTFPETLPTPVDAIKFRMEQEDLKPSDLIPYIGSRSRVSEILSGKRQLTLEMVRAIETGLGIPSKVLIRKPSQDKDVGYRNWSDRLLAEMKKRNYFSNTLLKKCNKEELFKNFFSLIGSPAQVTGMLRKSHYRSSPLTDRQALVVWATHVFKEAKKIKISKKYKHGVVNLGFMQKLVKLSTEDRSPILAQEYLKKQGIILIIEPHFSKTYLDGTTILINKENPVIGLTLRYDRLDNFWFTLMHELAHIAKHYDSGINLFYDELEGIKATDVSDKEREADILAEEALLPRAKWEISPARIVPSFMAANSLAKELKVHIAIIAGQIRYKGGKYIYLNKIVNESKVRKYFPNKKWNK